MTGLTCLLAVYAWLSPNLAPRMPLLTMKHQPHAPEIRDTAAPVSPDVSPAAAAVQEILRQQDAQQQKGMSKLVQKALRSPSAEGVAFAVVDGLCFAFHLSSHAAIYIERAFATARKRPQSAAERWRKRWERAVSAAPKDEPVFIELTDEEVALMWLATLDMPLESSVAGATVSKPAANTLVVKTAKPLVIKQPSPKPLVVMPPVIKPAVAEPATTKPPAAACHDAEVPAVVVMLDKNGALWMTAADALANVATETMWISVVAHASKRGDEDALQLSEVLSKTEDKRAWVMRLGESTWNQASDAVAQTAAQEEVSETDAREQWLAKLDASTWVRLQAALVEAARGDASVLSEDAVGAALAVVTEIARRVT